MTECNDMPKRAWLVYYDGWCVTFDENDAGVEYIRADSVPDVDVEDIAHEVGDVIFTAYGVNTDPSWLQRILREALGVAPPPRRAASKSEYKRVTALGGEILPPEVK